MAVLCVILLTFLDSFLLMAYYFLFNFLLILYYGNDVRQRVNLNCFFIQVVETGHDTRNTTGPRNINAHTVPWLFKGGCKEMESLVDGLWKLI